MVTKWKTLFTKFIYVEASCSSSSGTKTIMQVALECTDDEEDDIDFVKEKIDCLNITSEKMKSHVIDKLARTSPKYSQAKTETVKKP